MRRSVKISALALSVVFSCLRPAAAQQASTAPKPPALNVPLPVGQSATGVNIPINDEDGRKQMFLKVDSMLRKDNDHLQMTNTKIEVYNDEGVPDMGIDLPVSLFDLNTRIITSDRSFTIRQSDFELTGDTLEFNTVTRQGKVVGKVKLVIYNMDEFAK